MQVINQNDHNGHQAPIQEHSINLLGETFSLSAEIIRGSCVQVTLSDTKSNPVAHADFYISMGTVENGFVTVHDQAYEQLNQDSVHFELMGMLLPFAKEFCDSFMANLAIEENDSDYCCYISMDEYQEKLISCMVVHDETQISCASFGFMITDDGVKSGYDGEEPIYLSPDLVLDIDRQLSMRSFFHDCALSATQNWKKRHFPELDC